MCFNKSFITIIDTLITIFTSIVSILGIATYFSNKKYRLIISILSLISVILMFFQLIFKQDIFKKYLQDYNYDFLNYKENLKTLNDTFIENYDIENTFIKIN